MTRNTETYYPENRSKLLIMRGMPFSCSVVSLRGTGVSTGNSEEPLYTPNLMPVRKICRSGRIGRNAAQKEHTHYSSRNALGLSLRRGGSATLLEILRVDPVRYQPKASCALGGSRAP